MLPDLQHLIHLQEIDSAIDRTKRRIQEIPAAQQALESRSAAHAAAVQAVKDRITHTSAGRRDVEKEVAAVQGRLSKYKDQLMAVKTNKEYQAMQTEIATAEGLVRSYEDRLLDLMEVAEKESTDLRSAEAAMKSEEAAIVTERKALETEKTARHSELERLTSERSDLLKQIPPDVRAIYDRVAAMRGVRALRVVTAKPDVYPEARSVGVELASFHGSAPEA